MRPIDADALRKRLVGWLLEVEREHDYIRDVDYVAGIEDCIDAVADAPTIHAAPRWIPVTERLPELSGWVLAYVPDARSGRSQAGMVYWGGDRWEAVRSAAKRITHWMPLPTPPEVTQ